MDRQSLPAVFGSRSIEPLAGGAHRGGIDDIGDAHFCEIILQSDAPGAGVLIVITYFGQPVPPPGASVLVFEMRDIDGFVARAVAAGATVTTPVTRIAALDLAFAMLRDPQGHVFEALQRGGTK